MIGRPDLTHPEDYSHNIFGNEISDYDLYEDELSFDFQDMTWCYQPVMLGWEDHKWGFILAGPIACPVLS